MDLKPSHLVKADFTPGKDVDSLSTSWFSDKDKASVHSEIKCGENNLVVISECLKSMRSNLSG